MDSIHPWQQEIVEECLKKGSGGLSLVMGSGKTKISLEVALKQTEKSSKQILIIVSKSLIHSWEDELKKWFPKIKYQLLLLSDEINLKRRIILTTPTTIMKYYTQYEIQQRYITELRIGFGPLVVHYSKLREPILTAPKTFHSISFGTIIIDEAHGYLNIETKTCRGMASLYADHRWLLSGTLFAEPKMSNILGFYRLLNDQYFPDNLPDTKTLLTRRNFEGTLRATVYRNRNEMYINRPKIIQHVVKFNLSGFESSIYTMYKDIIKDIAEKIRIQKLLGNTERVRTLNAQLLSMISTLRQCIITPLIPLAKLYLSFIDTKKSEDVYKEIKKKMEEEGIYEQLNDPSNIISTRFNNVLKIFDSHKDERIVLFSSFRVSLEFFEPLVKEHSPNRRIYNLKAKDSAKKRGEILEEYATDPSGILLLTYELGSEGLNLQCATVVITLDFFWNESKTQQAIARIARFGQNKDINIYTFVSNTSIERAIFKRHREKSTISQELLENTSTFKITRMKTAELVKLITIEETDTDDARKSTYNG